MALVMAARNLAVSPNRATKNSSKARLWVYDRRLELLTRAFTLWGARAPVVSRAERVSQFLAAARPGQVYAAEGYRHRSYMNHVGISGLTSRDVRCLNLGWGDSLRIP